MHLEVEIYVSKEVNMPQKQLLLEMTKKLIANSNKVYNVNIRIEHPDLGSDIDFIRIWNPDNSVETCNSSVISAYRVVVLCNSSTTDNLQLEDSDSTTVASTNWDLPSRHFDGMWESLFFDNNVQLQLLSYSRASLHLSNKGVDPNIVCCNRLVLLHGPPGTGKTSLCKALAQKLSIQLSEVFSYAHLVEVNCHSLFSKWFSESGKLVSKLFENIKEYAQNSHILVIVLIDEVESLTSARQAAINNNEPSDAVRVVNAMLTQLDSLRSFNNVFVFATSNMTGAIDPAFADRADVIQYIGLPSSTHLNKILRSCLVELDRKEVFSFPLLPVLDISDLALRCEGLSGRAVRKLPLLALSQSYEPVRSADEFYKLLESAVSCLQANKKSFHTKLLS